MTDQFRKFALWCAAAGVAQVGLIVGKSLGYVSAPWLIVTVPLWGPAVVLGWTLMVCWFAHGVASWISRRVSGR